MPDAYARVKQGEREPVYGQATIAAGTLTIQASPAPVCTLKDSLGVNVPGLAGVAVTGYENTALAAPKAWYNLDTVGAPPTTPLAVGWYTLCFVFSAAGSDGITRIYEPNVSVHVVAANT